MVVIVLKIDARMIPLVPIHYLLRASPATNSSSLKYSKFLQNSSLLSVQKNNSRKHHWIFCFWGQLSWGHCICGFTWITSSFSWALISKFSLFLKATFLQNSPMQKFIKLLNQPDIGGLSKDYINIKTHKSL